MARTTAARALLQAAPSAVRVQAASALALAARHRRIVASGCRHVATAAVPIATAMATSVVRAQLLHTVLLPRPVAARRAATALLHAPQAAAIVAAEVAVAPLADHAPAAVAAEVAEASADAANPLTRNKYSNVTINIITKIRK